MLCRTFPFNSISTIQFFSFKGELIKHRKLDDGKTRWSRKQDQRPSHVNAQIPDSLCDTQNSGNDMQLVDSTHVKADNHEAAAQFDVADDKQQKKDRALAAETVVKCLTPYYKDSRFISKVT